ncbi:unnamed protein product [Closterium sp. Naga37s-1]|nr:unnamed protein product [Closterium sp. Naga37s-1]
MLRPRRNQKSSSNPRWSQDAAREGEEARQQAVAWQQRCAMVQEELQQRRSEAGFLTGEVSRLRTLLQVGWVEGGGSLALVGVWRAGGSGTAGAAGRSNGDNDREACAQGEEEGQGWAEPEGGTTGGMCADGSMSLLGASSSSAHALQSGFGEPGEGGGDRGGVSRGSGGAGEWREGDLERGASVGVGVGAGGRALGRGEQAGAGGGDGAEGGEGVGGEDRAASVAGSVEGGRAEWDGDTGGSVAGGGRNGGEATPAAVGGSIAAGGGVCERCGRGNGGSGSSRSHDAEEAAMLRFEHHQLALHSVTMTCMNCLFCFNPSSLTLRACRSTSHVPSGGATDGVDGSHGGGEENSSRHVCAMLRGAADGVDGSDGGGEESNHHAARLMESMAAMEAERQQLRIAVRDRDEVVRRVERDAQELRYANEEELRYANKEVRVEGPLLCASFPAAPCPVSSLWLLASPPVRSSWHPRTCRTPTASL